MSTLTKMLIVLVTLASISLCSIVVVYVANAEHYRELYNTERTAKQTLQETAEDKIKQFNELTVKAQVREDELDKEITAKNIEIEALKTELKNTIRRKDELLDKVSSLSSASETYSKTAIEQTRLAESMRTQLKEVDAERIKIRTQLEETSAILLEKLAIIQTLETEKKQLLEQKVALQSRLDKLLQPTGKRPTVPVTVTSDKDIARPAPVTTKDISLKGLVKAVNLKNKLVSISIGTADGVSEGMRFHVTRGDTFICDILIIDTDAEEAVGAIELTGEGQQPKAGDVISTNL